MLCYPHAWHPPATSYLARLPPEMVSQVTHGLSARDMLILQCALAGQIADPPVDRLADLRARRASASRHCPDDPWTSYLELLPCGLLDGYLDRPDLLNIELALIPVIDCELEDEPPTPLPPEWAPRVTTRWGKPLPLPPPGTRPQQRRRQRLQGRRERDSKRARVYE